MRAAKSPRRLPLRAATACLLAFSAGASSGCSFFLSNGPPANAAQLQDFKCEESYAPPIVDTVLASAGLVTSLALNGVAHALNGSSNARIGVFALITVGLPGTSAIYGYTQVRRCNAAERNAAGKSVRVTSKPPASDATLRLGEQVAADE